MRIVVCLLVSALRLGSQQLADDWQLVGKGYQLTADSSVAKDGTVYFTDHNKNRILKVDPGGKVSVWREPSGGAHGIAIGPDGRLYTGHHDQKRILAHSPDGKESIAAEDLQTHHLLVTQRSGIYAAEAPKHTVWFIDASGKKLSATTELNWPHGLRLSPDRSRLFVTDSHTRWVTSFEIQPDGSLASGKHFCQLETRNEDPDVDAGGMTFDTEGFLYVATKLGVQVFDSSGRFKELMVVPGMDGVTNVFFGGSRMKWLYVTDGEKLYRRLTKRGGAKM
jgi:gluconolactonase